MSLKSHWSFPIPSVVPDSADINVFWQAAKSMDQAAAATLCSSLAANISKELTLDGDFSWFIHITAADITPEFFAMRAVMVGLYNAEAAALAAASIARNPHPTQPDVQWQQDQANLDMRERLSQEMWILRNLMYKFQEGPGDYNHNVGKG